MNRKDAVNYFLRYLNDYTIFDDIPEDKKRIIADDMLYIAEHHIGMGIPYVYIPYSDEFKSLAKLGTFIDDNYYIKIRKWENE